MNDIEKKIRDLAESDFFENRETFSELIRAYLENNSTFIANKHQLTNEIAKEWMRTAWSVLNELGKKLRVLYESDRVEYEKLMFDIL